jgi:hypothetical protein
MNEPIRRILFGWVAGFVAALVAHQLVIAALHAAAFTPITPWPTAPAPPFGVPAVLSLGFWGGVWGIVLALLAPRFPHGGAFWPSIVLFGAVVLSLVAWFVVAPLKGAPTAAGFHAPPMVTSVLANAAWALLAGLLLRAARLA